MEIHASLKAEDVLVIGPVGITNSMVMTWLAMVVLVVVARRGTTAMALVPARMQGLVEYAAEFCLGLTVGSAGVAGRRYFPLIATIFLFILTANYMALLPGVSTISVGNPHAVHVGGGHAIGRVVEAAEVDTVSSIASRSTQPEGSPTPKHEASTVHLFRAANADLNMTLGMGLIAFLFIHASGVRAHGWKGYLEEIATPPFLTPVKVIIELFVPLSLSMRLFGNVFGGEMLMAAMNFPVIAVPFMAMELLFGFIQAMIFSMLTLIFTVLATTLPPGHGHGSSGHGSDAGH